MLLNLLHIVVLYACLILLDSYSCSGGNRFCRRAGTDNCFGLCIFISLCYFNVNYENSIDECSEVCCTLFTFRLSR